MSEFLWGHGGASVLTHGGVVTNSIVLWCVILCMVFVWNLQKMILK